MERRGRKSTCRGRGGYIYRPDELCHKGHGDITECTDERGTVLKRYEDNAFGNEQELELMDSNPWRYCGKYWGDEDRLGLNKYTYLPDNSAILQSGNRYVYCMGKATKKIDRYSFIKNGEMAWIVEPRHLPV